jgi:GNAT superfamily N-acetyltransferase
MAYSVIRAMGKNLWLFSFEVKRMTLPEQLDQISERIERTGMRAADALSLINMTFDEQMKRLDVSTPYEAFTGLSELFDQTVRGTKVERFRPTERRRRFHTLEIHTEEGEILGYLNMLYLKKTVPCYYLVYVEVMPPFRGLGLGTRIVNAFRVFLEDNRAVGLLDNIVPPDDPTYTIYTNLGWRPLREIIGDRGSDDWKNYMVLIPNSVQSQDLKGDLIRILFSLKKRRPIIEMHDNEDMVRRTIAEFKNVYEALEKLFREDLQSGSPNTLMNFMFTRLTTRLIGFHRRIESLIGYTGGESLEQLTFSGAVKRLALQPYSLWRFGEEDGGMWGNEEILRSLPLELKENPTIYIESLPYYRRPYLDNWMKRTGLQPTLTLSISDLLDFRFDPTRLREFHHKGIRYIFERISPLFFTALLRKRAFLKKLERTSTDLHFRGTIIRVNPIILVVRDRGNVYALRRQVEGIHSQEALDQLKTIHHLRTLNGAVGVDRCIQNVIKDIGGSLRRRFHTRFKREIEEVAYFIPWDIERNTPAIRVDISGISLDTVWLA